MRKIPCTLIFLLLACFAANGQTVSIPQPFVDTQVCDGTQLNVHYNVSSSFSPGNSFTVQLSDAAGSFGLPVAIGSVTDVNGGTIPCIVPGGIQPGTGYRIRITTSNPVTVSADNGKNISIQHPPAAPIMSCNSPVCEGDSLGLKILNPIQGVTYLWTIPGVGTFLSIAAAYSFQNATQTYAGLYHISSQFGSCTAETQVYVTVKPLPPKPTAGPDILTCSGDTIQLTALNNSAIPGFSWQGPGGYTANTQNPVIEGITMQQAGLYTVRAVDNGCFSQKKDSLWIDIVHTPELTLLTNSPVCEGDSLLLSATDTGLISYSWQGPGGFQSIDPVLHIAHATKDNTGTYYISASHFGCIAHDSIVAVLKPMPPQATISTNSPLCEDDTLFLSAKAGNVIGIVTYTWSGPDNYTSPGMNLAIPNVQEKNTGNYVLTIEMDGCKLYDTAKVQISPTPVIAAGGNTGVNAESRLELSSTSNIPGTSFSWRGPDAFSSTEQNPVITYATEANEGTYFVTGTYNGCSATDSIPVTVYDEVNYTVFRILPNPNNGNFTIKGRVKAPQTIPIDIYDSESGIKIYSSQVVSNGKLVEKKISLGRHLGTGVYIIRLKADGENNLLKLSIVQ